MRFWDSSALLPLLIEEPHSDTIKSIIKEDDNIVVWWAASLECRSAFARLKRDGLLSDSDEAELIELLGELSEAWSEIIPAENVRDTAARLIMTHPLRAADSMQLAAAIVWSGTPVQKSEFVCLDIKLREAAHKEGFVVLPRKLK